LALTGHCDAFAFRWYKKPKGKFSEDVSEKLLDKREQRMPRTVQIVSHWGEVWIKQILKCARTNIKKQSNIQVTTARNTHNRDLRVLVRLVP
jgi:hypothetical protein